MSHPTRGRSFFRTLSLLPLHPLLRKNKITDVVLYSFFSYQCIARKIWGFNREVHVLSSTQQGILYMRDPRTSWKAMFRKFPSSYDRNLVNLEWKNGCRAWMCDTVKIMCKDPFALYKNAQEQPRQMGSHLKLANCLLAWGSEIYEVALIECAINSVHTSHPHSSWLQGQGGKGNRSNSAQGCSLWKHPSTSPRRPRIVTWMGRRR